MSDLKDPAIPAAGTYTGRFAPSPTGPLHFGSLVAALASYIDAKANHGTWLLRIEDTDPPREMPGATDSILYSLEQHHLTWDGDVLYQSQRNEAYQETLDQLIRQEQAFPCTCSRKQLSASSGIHNSECSADPQQVPAWRFRVPSAGTATFTDVLQKSFSQDIQSEIGDFIVRRRDKLWAYQLAMVTDDAFQKVTHVVRGIDLIDSTLRQNMLREALGFSLPVHAHIPVACADNGQKLSKQNHAPELDNTTPSLNLWRALSWLRQEPPATLASEHPDTILSWSIANWHPERLTGVKSQPAEQV